MFSKAYGFESLEAERVDVVDGRAVDDQHFDVKLGRLELTDISGCVHVEHVVEFLQVVHFALVLRVVVLYFEGSRRRLSHGLDLNISRAAFVFVRLLFDDRADRSMLFGVVEFVVHLVASRETTLLVVFDAKQGRFLLRNSVCIPLAKYLE